MKTVTPSDLKVSYPFDAFGFASQSCRPYSHRLRIMFVRLGDPGGSSSIICYRFCKNTRNTMVEAICQSNSGGNKYGDLTSCFDAPSTGGLPDIRVCTGRERENALMFSEVLEAPRMTQTFNFLYVI
jgi:hypothetical protein